jgi:sulfotransferase
MTLHFISGIARSGSTLLSAILKQNPRFSAAMTSLLFTTLEGALRTMSAEGGYAACDVQRENVLRAVLRSFYEHLDPSTVVFDTSRGWCRMMSLLACLSPESRVVCCVRNPAWVLDSVERLVHANPLLQSRIFGEMERTVYTRVEALSTRGFVGAGVQSFKEAWYGEQAKRLIVVRYDSLVSNPDAVISQLYRELNLEPFLHDFENVEYDAEDFDLRLNMPGLHRVRGRVEPRPRETILPPELFGQFSREFWNEPAENKRGVLVL